MKTIREVFSNNLKSLRGARTQAELAEAARMPLVSYQRAEGGVIPQGPNLAAIAKALGVSEARLFLDASEAKDLAARKLALIAIIAELNEAEVGDMEAAARSTKHLSNLGTGGKSTLKQG